MPGAARLPDGSPRALLPPPGALSVLDVPAVRRWALLTRSVFAARRVEIDALNVFPVPDGDTGTNLFLTFDGAVERMLTHDPHGAGDLLAAFAKALLWTARGNSGVILSQLARGLAEACADADVIDGPLLARGLVRAEERARQAVTDPQEGTILSVATAMATAAVEAAEATLSAAEATPSAEADGPADPSLYAVSLAALEAARVALEHTPEQLEVLARAGVVDAGGAGLVILLECLERICSGQRGRPSDDPSGRRGRFRAEPVGPLSAGRSEGPLHHDVGDGSPAYEVMYLLADSDEEAVALLRARLVELGDSVLVVGGDGEWNVHAHVDDAGAAVEAGIVAGRPHRVRITWLDRDVVPLLACRRGRGGAPRRARSSPRSAPSTPRAPPASSCCPTTATPCSQRQPRRGPWPTTASTHRSSTLARRCRGLRRSPSSSPRHPRPPPSSPCSRRRRRRGTARSPWPTGLP